MTVLDSAITDNRELRKLVEQASELASELHVLTEYQDAPSAFIADVSDAIENALLEALASTHLPDLREFSDNALHEAGAEHFKAAAKGLLT